MRLIWIVMAASVAVGCGGGAGEAADECEALYDRICTRFLDCGVVGITSQDQCLDALNDQFDCGDADRVGPTYNSCMTTLETIACADLYPNMTIALPADCMNVILVEQ